jgi:hypothetical protein
MQLLTLARTTCRRQQLLQVEDQAFSESQQRSLPS